MDYPRRQKALKQSLAKERLDALLVTHPVNVRYLCGFTGSSGVLALRGSRWAFFTDGRYTEQAQQQVQGARVVTAKGSPLAAAAAWLGKSSSLSALGIEAAHMTVAARSALRGMLPKTTRLHETNGLVERLRMVKEPEEIELIRGAVLTGAALLDTALETIKPGVSETTVAAEMEYAARSAAAEAMSFPTIVAAGARSALPHGVASSQPIPRNGFVVMDFGVILAGYCSDMTRTVHVGRPKPAMRDLYRAVLEAQLAGIAAVRAGVEASEVDRAARKVLRRAKLDRYFTHSTGHGVGLEIHEPPRMGQGSSDVLMPGMVITVEPGAYIPGQGGVRIEDMVVVTEQGCEVLTPAPKELITL